MLVAEDMIIDTLPVRALNVFIRQAVLQRGNVILQGRDGSIVESLGDAAKRSQTVAMSFPLCDGDGSTWMTEVYHFGAPHGGCCVFWVLHLLISQLEHPPNKKQHNVGGPISSWETNPVFLISLRKVRLPATTSNAHACL